MSWKTAGKLVSGPPVASGSGSSNKYRQNTGGLNAFQREQQFAAHYNRKDREVDEFGKEGRTDWDVLKENHRFIRDDEDAGDVSWEERLARAYESKLFKEFALIDLKHYKSRRLALRWRTAEEVVEGLGEETCGSLRCKYHLTPQGTRVRVEGEKERKRVKKIPTLRAFELPFVYAEAGQRKEALVKVRLCGRCEWKLTWKPGHERSTKARGASSEAEDDDEEGSVEEAKFENGIRRRRERSDREQSRNSDDGREDRRDGRGSRYRPRSRSLSRSPKVEPHSRSRSRSRSPRRDRDRNLI